MRGGSKATFERGPRRGGGGEEVREGKVREWTHEFVSKISFEGGDYLADAGEGGYVCYDAFEFRGSFCRSVRGGGGGAVEVSDLGGCHDGSGLTWGRGGGGSRHLG